MDKRIPVLMMILALAPRALRAQEGALAQAFLQAQGLLLAAQQSGAPPAQPAEEAQPWGDANVERQLGGSGIVGLVHGSAPGERLWVLAVYNPDNFFDFRLYPLRPSGAEAAKKLEGLKLERHDRVRVVGAFRSDPPHILLKDIELLRADPTDYSHQAAELRLPLALQGKTEFELQAQVHGVLRRGHQVAVEYQNHILPLSLEDPADEEAAKALNALWRGDVIKVHVKVRGSPQKPTHLVFSPKKGLTVLERVRDLQGQKVDVEGALVLFPRTPVLTMDVWAVAVTSPRTGVTRYYTLNNFADPEKWRQMSNNLRRAWDQNKSGIVQGRNKFINSQLRVRVRGRVSDLGTGNEALAQNQANQSVQVTEPEDVEILPRPNS